MRTYSIYEGNLERLESKLTRIGNKCRKYGCSFHYEKVGEEFKSFNDELGVEHLRRFVIVEAEGQALVNGWQFVATLEHTKSGNLVHAVEGAPDIPSRYYDCAPFCEHCRTSRERKKSMIVRNTETGEFKQVGSKCLQDFTGGMSAEAVADWLSMFNELYVAEEIPEGLGSRGEDYYPTAEMLTYFIEAVNRFGYARTTDADSTREVGFVLWRRDHDKLSDFEKRRYKEYLEQADRHNFKANTEQNNATAQACLEWGKTLQGDSNYVQNLRVICSSDGVSARNLGLLSSVLPSMNKELERQAERRERERRAREEAIGSNYVGEVGDRLKVKVASMECVTSWYTEWGLTCLYKFLDEQGNVYIWKTGSYDGEYDSVVEVTGTVKEHNEYNGVKQTVLTRCKVTSSN